MHDQPPSAASLIFLDRCTSRIRCCLFLNAPIYLPLLSTPHRPSLPFTSPSPPSTGTTAGAMQQCGVPEFLQEKDPPHAPPSIGRKSSKEQLRTKGKESPNQKGTSAGRSPTTPPNPLLRPNPSPAERSGIKAFVYLDLLRTNTKQTDRQTDRERERERELRKPCMTGRSNRTEKILHEGSSQAVWLVRFQVTR
mmetsp:Transcript_35358/g.69776  ORF Transcript_35358/g.69776 Transcript_35358/m.69776 type:complete len:194 (-) Transcript_35358:2340-2921(-)